MRQRWIMDEWRDAFLLEARMHQVPGDRIGEALAEIDAHCADSGQEPAEAFGDPVRYAGELARSAPPAAGRAGPGRELLGHVRTAVATLAGIAGILSGVDALADGERGVLTAGQLASVAAGTAGIAYIGGVVLRPGRRGGRWHLPVAVMASLALMMLPQVWWRAPALRAPAWLLLAAGLCVLAVAWSPLASGRVVADPVVDPRTGREPFRAPRWLRLVGSWWTLPVLLLVVVLVTVLVPGPR
ncbi:MAG TPA: hypothetical protein VES42_12715 [Pilimelia sp.]|nr:hypothetical protein [Pilimelia sp.]